MNYKTYRLRNASEIKSIKKKLENVFQHSITEWGLDINQYDYTSDIYDAYKRNIVLANDANESWGVLYGDNKDEWIAVKQGEKIINVLFDELFSNFVSQDGGRVSRSVLFNNVVESFLSDFLNNFLKEIKDLSGSKEIENFIDFPALKKGCGILKADLMLREMRLELIISDNLITRYISKREPAYKELVTYKQAVEPKHIPLSAFVGDIKLNIKELKELEPGDVLDINKAISEPISLFSSGKKICSGYLCQKENMKTIQLVSI